MKNVQACVYVDVKMFLHSDRSGWETWSKSSLLFHFMSNQTSDKITGLKHICKNWASTLIVSIITSQDGYKIYLHEWVCMHTFNRSDMHSQQANYINVHF